MLDVSRWLADHGLGHHAEVFAQNGIAGDILCEITDAELLCDALLRRAYFVVTKSISSNPVPRTW